MCINEAYFYKERFLEIVVSCRSVLDFFSLFSECIGLIRLEIDSCASIEPVLSNNINSRCNCECKVVRIREKYTISVTRVTLYQKNR